MGRESEYTPEIGVKIADLLSGGELTFEDIAKEIGYSDKTIHKWRHRYPEFGEMIARVQEGAVCESYYNRFEKVTMEMLDGKHDAREMHALNTACQNLKWMMAKRNPKKYSDVNQVRLADNDGGKLPLAEFATGVNNIDTPIIPTRNKEI